MFQITVLSFAILIISVSAFGNAGSKPKKGERDDEVDIWPCWHAINCEMDDVFEEMKVCYSKLDDSDMEVYVYEWLYDYGHKDLNTIVPKELCTKLCPLDMDEKKKTFDYCVKKYMDTFSKACHKEEHKDACERIQNFMDCAKELLDREKDKGNCGAE